MSFKKYFIYAYLCINVISLGAAEEKESAVDTMHVMTNPFVVLAGASRYDSHRQLAGVDKDMSMLKDTFVKEYGYHVVSTYDRQTVDKGYLDSDELSQFLLDQRKFLKQKFKEDIHAFDGLISIYAGHGDGDHDGGDSIIASDGERMAFFDFRQFLFEENKRTAECLRGKPKLFFKLVCRGEQKPDRIKKDIEKHDVRAPKSFHNREAEVCILYANVPEYKILDSTKGSYCVLAFAKILSEQLHHPKRFGDIMLQLKSDVKEKSVAMEVPRVESGLTKKLCFCKKGTDKHSFQRSMQAVVLKSPKEKIDLPNEMYKDAFKYVKKGGAHNFIKWYRSVSGEYKVDLNIKYNNYSDNHVSHTFLTWCCFKDYNELGKHLIDGLVKQKQDLNVRSESKYKYTALHWCCERGHEELGKHLIDGLVKQKQDLNLRDESNFKSTALHWCCVKGHEELGKHLIDGLVMQKEDLNLRDEHQYRYTALHWCCALSREELGKQLIDALVKQKQDLNLRDESNFKSTALHWCCVKGHEELGKHLIDALVKKKQDLNLRGESNFKYTALHWCCEKGHVALGKHLIDALVKQKEDLNLRCENDEKYTALHWCCERGHEELGKQLIDGLVKQKQDLNVRDESNFKYTALHWCCEKGHVALGKHLIDGLVKQKQDLNVRSESKYKYTALHWCCTQGHEEIGRALLNAGADPYLMTKNGYNAMGVAKYFKRKKMVKLIENHINQGTNQRYNQQNQEEKKDNQKEDSQKEKKDNCLIM